jgi:hypothetical protein
MEAIVLRRLLLLLLFQIFSGVICLCSYEMKGSICRCILREHHLHLGPISIPIRHGV